MRPVVPTRDLALGLALALIPSCARSNPAASPNEARDEDGDVALAVDPVALSTRDRRSALKIARSPFAYFRYTNRPFTDLVCGKYASMLPQMPMVLVHGDAHLEQYAVAAEGRGLADFDASAVGPPVIDLVRFATSLVLAADASSSTNAKGADSEARAAIDAFVRGYARALDDPQATVPEPAVAQRLRARFAKTTGEWLDSVQRLMIPTLPEDQAKYDAGWAEFVAQMRAGDPSIPPTFFKIKIGGRLDMGIGSAHADKFLVRIEGPTDAPDDDLVMEAKAVTKDTLGKCLRGAELDPRRIITGQAQLSNTPQRFLAAVTINGKPFYSHTWLVHYTELSVSDVHSAAELAEVSEEIGVQLGHGHSRSSSNETERRTALVRALRLVTPSLFEVARSMALDVRRAWAKYRQHLPT